MTRQLPPALFFVLGMALLLRLGWGLARPTNDAAIDALPDQREYLSIASNLLAGHGAQFIDPRFGQKVFAYRMPGYPCLIALCGCDLRVIRVVQAILDTSSVLAVFLISRRLSGGLNAGHRPAILAAIFVAVNPFLIYFSSLVLSDTLFTATLAWGMVFLLSAPPRGLVWFWGAIVLALSIYVRPSGMLLALFLAIASAWPRREAWKRGAFTAAMLVAVLAPWAWRNARPTVLGHWIWTTTNGGITAYDGWNPTANGGSNQAFVAAMPELRDMNEVQRSEYLAALARKYVMDHPRRAAALAFEKLVRLWSPIPLSEQYSSLTYRAAGLLYCVSFDLLVLAGLIRGRLSPTAKVFLLLPAIYLTAVHMASVGSLRYLLPAIPPMSVLAGSTLSNLRPGRMG